MADDKQPFLNIPLDENLDQMVEEMRKANGNQSRAAVGRMAIHKLYEEFIHVNKIKKAIQPKIKAVAKS